MKITGACLNDCKQIPRLVYGKSKVQPSGYLLWQGEEERPDDIYNCFIYKGHSGTILIKDSICVLPDAIRYHIKLNNHVRVTDVRVGYIDDDKDKNLISATLTFRFNITTFFANLFGY